MKTTSPSKRSKRLVLTALLCTGSLLFNSCTTTNTAYQVQTQPMNPDLEKQILRETGLSGMGIGAVAGAAGGAVLGAVAAKMAGGNADQVRRMAIAGAVAGGAAGGYAGYQKGKQQGQQMVSSGMTRDKARQLVKAARAENERLASFNAGLRRKIASTKAINDPKERKIAFTTLRQQAETTKRKCDATIAMRNKALQTKDWGNGTSGSRSDYKASTDEMIQHQKALALLTANVEQSIVY